MEQPVDFPAEPLKNSNEPASDQFLVESKNLRPDEISSSIDNQKRE